MESVMGVQALPQLELFGASVIQAVAVAPRDSQSPTRAAPRQSLEDSVDDEDEPQMGLHLPAIPLNDVDWDENEIYGLLEGMLADRLAALGDERTSVEVRAEVIRWVAKPLLTLSKIRVAATVRKDPFCFQSCCYAAGVDPEEMQERVLAMVKRGRLR